MIEVLAILALVLLLAFPANAGETRTFNGYARATATADTPPGSCIIERWEKVRPSDSKTVTTGGYPFAKQANHVISVDLMINATGVTEYWISVDYQDASRLFPPQSTIPTDSDLDAMLVKWKAAQR